MDRLQAVSNRNPGYIIENITVRLYNIETEKRTEKGGKNGRNYNNKR